MKSKLLKKLTELGYEEIYKSFGCFVKDYEKDNNYFRQVIDVDLQKNEVIQYGVECLTECIFREDIKDIQIAMNRAERDFKELKELENESKRIQSKI